jgi:hypothetical protein
MSCNDTIDNRSIFDHGGGDENYPAVGEAPCHQQSAFEEAAAAIVCGKSEGASQTASFGIEVTNLENWAKQNQKLIPEEVVERLQPVSNSTSEHEVFLRTEDGRAVKRTWAGIYGQIPCVGVNNLDRRNATPSEYLSRMALHIHVFGSDIQLEGVTITQKPSMLIGQPSGQPSIVISQRWYEKQGIVTNEDVYELMVQEGFRAVPASYFGWYRPADGVVIVDAKPDNFIKTSDGLLPIDLQMTQFSEQELTSAGLHSDDQAPVIFIPR